MIKIMQLIITIFLFFPLNQTNFQTEILLKIVRILSMKVKEVPLINHKKCKRITIAKMEIASKKRFQFRDLFRSVMIKTILAANKI